MHCSLASDRTQQNRANVRQICALNNSLGLFLHRSRIGCNALPTHGRPGGSRLKSPVLRWPG
jgi:hypothetical protein